MKTRRFEFLLEAAQPIAHHEGTIGNHAIVMRRKVRQPDGTFAHVPIITGDTMRHGLREASAWALLDAAGMLPNGQGGQLSRSALRLLFSGGMVSGRGDAGAINLDQYRQMVELVPSLALFGGCASNRVVPGRLFVEDATLVCAETRAWLPAWASDAMGQQELAGQRAHVEEVQRVRMDPLLDPSKCKVLSDGEQIAQNKQLASSEAAHGADDAIERDASKSSMMPRTFERVVQGSLFTWGIQATTFTDLDDDTLMTALGVFLTRPIIGGKRGTGHGELRVVSARDIAVRRPSEHADVVDMTALGGRVGDLFRAHVSERRDRIAEFLAAVDA